MVEKYPGKVKVVFKNFPLPNHNMALPAAQAALAAHAQGKFWEYHDKIFASYSNLSDQKFIEFANELQLNMQKFNQDRISVQVKSQIDQDLGFVEEIGINATPTVFINGVKWEIGTDDVVKLIEDELKRKSK